MRKSFSTRFWSRKSRLPPPRPASRPEEAGNESDRLPLLIAVGISPAAIIPRGDNQRHRRARRRRVMAAGGRLRIGIITDGLMERRIGGEVRIANGGVGVYIYQLIKHLFEVDGVNEYFLIRFGAGELDVYRHPRARSVFLRSTRISRTLGAADAPYAVLARKYGLDLLHYPNQFGGAFLPRHIKRVATLHDLTPLLFPQL